MPVIPTILFAAAMGVNIYAIILMFRIRNKYGLPPLFTMTLSDHLKPVENDDYKKEMKRVNRRCRFWLWLFLLSFILSIIFELP